MLSRSSLLFLVGACWLASCGSPEKEVQVDPETDDDQSAGGGAAGDDTVPSFTDPDDDVGPEAPDDDVSTGDDTAGDDTAGDDTAGDDTVADDDLGPTEPGAGGGPAGDDDVSVGGGPTPGDDATPADDDIGTDDDGTTPEPSGGLGTVGAACETDGDCLSGLECMDETKTYFGGTYPHGVCTASCELDARICVDFGAACVGDDVESWCMAPCAIGSVGIKCRADQACFPIQYGDYVYGVCDAMCRDDLDCPEGMECEAASGLCTDMPHSGDAVGTACTRETADACQGQVCLSSGPDATDGTCSQVCGLTEDFRACGVPRDAEGPSDAICDPFVTYIATGLSLAPGDFGLCSKTCDDNADCETGWECVDYPEEAQPLIGHTGVCLPSAALTQPGDAGAPPPAE